MQQKKKITTEEGKNEFLFAVKIYWSKEKWKKKKKRTKINDAGNNNVVEALSKGWKYIWLYNLHD